MHSLEIPVFIFISYLLGSISAGLLIGMCLGKDIRKSGSGNIGATNTFRVAGAAAGIVTLLFDVLKGALPAVVLPLLLNSETPPPFAGILFGTCAFCGHVWPVFLRFRGGKGVATALGVFLVLAPYALLVALGMAAIIIAVSRIVSLGSLMGTLVFLVSYWLFYSNTWIFAGALFISFIIVIRHKANIQRLLQGGENRL